MGHRGGGWANHRDEPGRKDERNAREDRSISPALPHRESPYRGAFTLIRSRPVEPLALARGVRVGRPPRPQGPAHDARPPRRSPGRGRPMKRAPSFEARTQPGPGLASAHDLEIDD